MKRAGSDDSLRCSFCHTSQERVVKLIANPDSFQPRAYICDECIMACYAILNDDGEIPGISFLQTTPPDAN